MLPRALRHTVSDDSFKQLCSARLRLFPSGVSHPQCAAVASHSLSSGKMASRLHQRGTKATKLPKSNNMAGQLAYNVWASAEALPMVGGVARDVRYIFLNRLRDAVRAQRSLQPGGQVAQCGLPLAAAGQRVGRGAGTPQQP